MTNRVEYDDDGYLDEIVTDGGAFLEKMSGNGKGESWFLSLQRADGSEICVWIEGKIHLIEERPATEGRAKP